MSRARGAIAVRSMPKELGMDTHLSEDLRQTLADLEPPKVSKFSDSDSLLTKVLKDKQKRVNADKAKRQREEAYQKARDAAGGSDSDQEGGEDEWAAAKKAKFEESRAARQRQIRAQAGPPTFKQALFPVELVEAAEPNFEGEDLFEASVGLLGDQAESSDAVTLSRELLLGGWLHHWYSRRHPLPNGLQCSLFQLAVHSQDSEVARRAYDLLAAALNSEPLGDQLFGRQGSFPAGSSVHAHVKSKPCTCPLDDAAFAAAFATLGYQNPDGPGRARGVKPSKKAGTTTPVKAASQKADADGQGKPGNSAGEQGSRPPRVQSLQLLARLLARVAKMQASGRCSSLSAGGIQQLLATVLQLRLDSAGCVLAVDLEAAAAALLDAFPEADWTRKFGDLAALIAGLGGSHRGGVDAIRLLPSDSGRAELLRSHAAVHLLSGLLLPKGKKPPTASKARGGPQPVDPAEVVHALGWFEGGDGFLRLAKNVRTGVLSIWELRSAIELVDVMLWPYVKEVKEGAEEHPHEAFVAKWHNFCQKLGNHMSKDDQGASIRLLITTIITRDNSSVY